MNFTIRLAASKSILLASFEQQQQFDPTGTLPNNFAFEISREKALEEYEAKKNRKSAEPVKEVEKINVEIPVDDSSCDSSDVGTKTEIILNIEAFVSWITKFLCAIIIISSYYSLVSNFTKYTKTFSPLCFI